MASGISVNKDANEIIAVASVVALAPAVSENNQPKAIMKA